MKNFHKVPILLLLFLSGVCGLVYEILWSRYLALFLGNTTLAHTLVLSVFMGGLALGNWFLGRYSDKSSNPIKLYAWLELGIALWGGIYPMLHRFLENFYFSQFSSMSPEWAVTVKSLFCIAAILPPTLLMGGTIPALARSANLGALYTVNSLGAVTGTILAGFFLIPLLGLDASMMSAALMNALIGAFALALSKNLDTAAPAQETEAEEMKGAKLILLAAGISGFCAMVYEIAWTRVFALVLGSSTYAFTLMLAAFISGIVLGAWAISVSKPVSEKTGRKLFAIAQWGIALSLLATLPLYDRLPYEFGRLLFWLKRLEAPFYAYQVAGFLICFSLMLLPTFFSGLSLPLAGRLVNSKLKFLGRETGALFAINTFGTLLGAAIGGLILLPAVGIENTFRAGVALTAINGWMILKGALPISKRGRVGLGVFIALGFYLLLGPQWSATQLNAGYFRHGAQRHNQTYEEFRKEHQNIQTLYHKDGANGTVSVWKLPDGELALKVNGKPDASSSQDLPTQLLLAHVPLVLFSNTQTQGPVRVLIVGLGSGITADAVLSHPNTEVDVVEISQEVAEGAAQFAPYNHNALKNPRLNLIIDDAKNYLQRTKKKYHVIISEPSNPWMAGIGGLFSKEHFEQARRALESGGVIAQWFHAYETDDDSIRMILRTMQSVFEFTSLWSAGAADFILTASPQPPAYTFSSMERAVKQESVAADLKRIDIENLAAFLSTHVSEDTPLMELTGRGKINSDYFPYLEFDAPKAFYAGGSSLLLARADMRRASSPLWRESLLNRYLKGRALRFEELKSMLLYHVRRGGALSANLTPSLMRETMKRGEEGFSLAAPLLVSLKIRQGDLGGAAEILEEALKLKNPEAGMLYQLADITRKRLNAELSAFHRPDPSPIFKLLERCAQLNPEKRDFYMEQKAEIRREWGYN